MADELAVRRKNQRYYAKHSSELRAKGKSWYEENRVARLAAIKEYRTTPMGVFTNQRRQAKIRGVEFLLTYDQWWAKWQPHWATRKQDKRIMCRLVEPGPYSVDNAYIGDYRSNREDHCRNRGIIRKRSARV